MKLFKKITLTAVTALTLAGVGVAGVSSLDTTTSVQAAPTTATLQKQISDLNNQVAKLNSKVSAKQLQINKINAQNVKIQKEIVATKNDIKKAKKELSDRKDVLKDQVVELQKQTNNSVSGNIYVDYLLNAGDFSELIGRAMAVGKISSANKAAIDDVNEAKAKLDDLAADQADRKQDIEANKAKAESEMVALASSKKKATASQKKLQAQMWENRSALKAQTTADSKKTQSLINTKTFTGSSSLISNAAQFIGVPYVWGGSTPSGFDCSGLVAYAANMAGISLPRTAKEQSQVGSYVSVSDLQAGDLVFWGGVGSAYHVGIYIGGGQYIHAPKPGENVKVGSVAYFSPSFGKRL